MKESLTKDQEEAPKKVAPKKEKKPKSQGGFQIWTELDVQRNKLMVGGLYSLWSHFLM